MDEMADGVENDIDTQGSGNSVGHTESMKVESDVKPRGLKLGPAVPRKPASGWMIATIMLGVAVAGLAGWVVCLMTSEQVNCKNDESNNAVEVAELETMTKNDEKVREAVRLLDEKLRELLVFGEVSFAWSVVPTYDFHPSVVYKIPDASLLVALTRTYGEYVPKDDSPLMQGFMSSHADKALGEVLRKNGFSLYEYHSNGSSQYFNQEAGVMCALSTLELPYSYQCGHITTVASSDLELEKELGNAVFEKTGAVVQINDISEVVDSEYKPYQRLKAHIGAAGLFYRTDPEAKWQFFTGTQYFLGCEEYDTDDVRKAFAGAECYDYEIGQNSVVRP